MKATLTKFDRLMMAVTFAEVNVDVDVGVIAPREKHCKGRECGSQKPQAKGLYKTKAIEAGS